MKTLFYKRKKTSLKSAVLLLTFWVLAFANMQCKKDKLPIEQLPAATQTGAKTFGCLVDGRAFTPTIKYIYNNSFNYGYDPAYGLGIEVINEDSKADYLGHMFINLRITNLEEGKTYALTEYNIAGKGGAKYTDLSGTPIVSGNYETSSLTAGSITITKLDSVKQIVSGTFSFKATDTSNGKIINVTGGRFDLTFK